MNILSRSFLHSLILGLGVACTSTDSSVPPAQTEPTTTNERSIPPPTFVAVSYTHLTLPTKA